MLFHYLTLPYLYPTIQNGTQLYQHKHPTAPHLTPPLPCSTQPNQTILHDTITIHYPTLQDFTTTIPYLYKILNRPYPPLRNCPRPINSPYLNNSMIFFIVISLCGINVTSNSIFLPSLI